MVTPSTGPGAGVEGTGVGVADADADVEVGDAVAAVADGVRGPAGACAVPHAVRRRRLAQHAEMPAS
jgi:hypothetical protein